METNYPGYNTKTNNGTNKDYSAIKRSTLSLASNTSDRETCFSVIEAYLAYFKDNHIIFTDTKTSPRNLPDKGKTPDIVRQNNDPLLGTWSKADGSLSIKIIKTGATTYQGHLLSKDGKRAKNTLFFQLFGNDQSFKIRKQNSWLTTDLLRGRILNDALIEPGGIWYRTEKGKTVSKKKQTTMPWNDQARSQQLGKNAYYLGIPAFNIKESEFDSIVVNDLIPKINSDKIGHLIIDLRNNFGGNSSFLSLLRLTYETPFSVPGDFLFASPEIIEKYTRDASNGSERHQKLLPKLIANKGGFVQRDSLRIRLKKNFDYPKQISIIVNDNCASSTEYFLLLAKNSSRVKIYGRPTAGTLDYSELHTPQELPCKDYRYLRPTTKSFYTDESPIDSIGIAPDVDLSAYPDHEWVEIILAMKKKN